MRYAHDLLVDIFERDEGRCHLCGSRRVLSAYGQRRRRGHWETDHSNALANGGSNSFQNLRVACICCNRAKGAMPTRAFRRQMGYLPASPRKHVEASTLLFWGGLIVAVLLMSRASQPN